MKSNRNVNGNGRRSLKLRAVDPRTAFFRDLRRDLSDANVAVLGCGSLGSFAAWALASAGIGKLYLADCDRLSHDNLRRHACTASDVGSGKSSSLARALRCRFPRLQVSAHDYCFLKNPDRLHELLAESTIGLVAIDCEGPKYVVNDILWYLRRPAVFAGIYGGGWGAEFVLVDPARGTACYGCAANSLGRVGVSLNDTQRPPPYAMPSGRNSARRRAPSVEREDERADVNEADPQSPDNLDHWMQASLTSIMPAAGLAADLVTAWLDANHGYQQRLQEFMQEGASAWRLAIRRVPAWRLGPWSLQRINVDGRTACPQRCGIPDEVAA